MQTGVQVLFAFLLTVPLAARFPSLSGFQRVDYFVTLLAAGAAAVLLIAPTAHHRILFRCGDKEHLVQVANRLTLAGLAFVAVSMVGAMLLVADLVFGGVVVFATAALAATGCAMLWCLAPWAADARFGAAPGHGPGTSRPGHGGAGSLGLTSAREGLRPDGCVQAATRRSASPSEKNNRASWTRSCRPISTRACSAG